MKRIILSLVMALMLVSVIAVPVLAAGKNGPAGKSNTGHVSLYEKDAAWAIVDGGAWGKFNYQLSDDADTVVSGVFNGRGLVAGTEYSLIYYPEEVDNPWTTPPEVQVIGEGTANGGGNVHISGTATIGIPDTQPVVGDYYGQTGDKIWLVLSTDLTTVDEVTTMTGWTPTEYLFEQALINTP